MSQARVQLVDGCLRLSGDLNSQTGPLLRKEGQRLLRQINTPVIRVDCSEVTRSSSVGLSLLLAYMRDAKALGRSLSVLALPDEMRQIAEVSGLGDVLPLNLI